MDAVPVITLVVAFMSLLLGGGLLMQKRKEGVEWGTLVTEVRQLRHEVEKIGSRGDEQRDEMTRLTTVVGDNRSGLVSEVAGLRESRHRTGDVVQAQGGKIELAERTIEDHEHRITHIEKESQ